MSAAASNPAGEGAAPRPAWLLLALLAPLAAMVAATPARLVLGCGAGLGLAVGLLGTVAFAVLLVRLERGALTRGSPWTAGVLLLAAAAIAGLLIRLLYNPLVWGMPNTPYEPDAGSHAVYYYQFNEEGIDNYSGCLSFHLVAWWLARLSRLTVFYGFRAAFYVGVAALPLALAAVVAALLPRRASTAGVAAAFALVSGAIGYELLFPLIHYYQIQASYSQIFMLFPVFLGWALYATCQTPLARALTALFALGLTRYTYGLNLGDLFLAYALMSVAEAIDLHGGWRRAVALALAAGFAALAVVAYQRLWSLRSEGGPCCQGLTLDPAMWGQLLGALFLVAAPLLVRLTPSGLRAVRFAGACAIVTAAVQYLYLTRGLPRQYYINKYPFFGAVMVGAGLMVVAVAAVAQLTTPEGGRARAAIALALTAAAAGGSLWQMNLGFAGYRASAAERMAWRPPFRSFGPLYNRDAAKFIKRILAEEHKQFDGFFSTNIALTFFMNEEFRGRSLAWWPWYNDPDWTPRGTALPAPGSCAFWDQPASQFYAQHIPHAKKIAEYEDHPQTRCSWYHPRWERRGAQSVLCALCQ